MATSPSCASSARFPSISAQPAHKADIERAARFAADRLAAAGIADVAIRPTPGHPVVTAAWHGDDHAPTVLVYGHYDVQPPDPLEAWQTPPFEPDVRDGRLYARGASDEKGPLLIPILVAEAFLAVRASLPVNLKLLIEGEEEIGSPHLEAATHALADRPTRIFTVRTSSSGSRACATASWPGPASWRRSAPVSGRPSQ